MYYSEARIDGSVDNSVIIDNTHIEFTKEMKDLGDTYTLEYDVTNGSKNYDASLSINCTGSSEYLDINNSFDTSTNLLATETRTGTLTVELVKSFTGTSEDVSISCEINANAVERDSLATGTPVDKLFTAFATDSWETIAKNVKSGNISQYKVGDTKTVDMGEFGTHTVRVANTSKCTNGETSETACGFVVEFADIINQYHVNSEDSTGGWPAMSIRAYVNDTIYNALPSDLQSVIANTTVVSSHGPNDSSNFTSIDKLYLLSTKEVWGENDVQTKYGTDTADEETRQLDYYANKGVTTSNYSAVAKVYNGYTDVRDNNWWLRSAPSEYEMGYFCAQSDGSLGYNGIIIIYGVSPAFRIA